MCLLLHQVVDYGFHPFEAVSLVAGGRRIVLVFLADASRPSTLAAVAHGVRRRRKRAANLAALALPAALRALANLSPFMDYLFISKTI